MADDKVDDDKVDYLDVDDSIPGQNYACLSFVSPDELIEKKKVIMYVSSFSLIVRNKS